MRPGVNQSECESESEHTNSDSRSHTDTHSFCSEQPVYFTRFLKADPKIK